MSYYEPSTYEILSKYFFIIKESVYNGEAKPRIRTFNLLNGLILATLIS